MICLYKDTILNADSFSLEICDSTCLSIKGTYWLEYKRCPVQKIFVKDWRGRVVQGRIDKIPKQITASIITSLWIPFFSSNELPGTDDRTKCYQFMVANYPVCSMTESLKNSLLTYTENAITKLILQATFSFNTTDGETAESNAATEAFVNFMSNGKELSRKFVSTSHQLFNTTKQLARNYYFKLLDYGAISGEKDSFENKNLKIFSFSRWKKLIESLQPLHVMGEETFHGGGRLHIKMSVVTRCDLEDHANKKILNRYADHMWGSTYCLHQVSEAGHFNDHWK